MTDELAQLINEIKEAADDAALTIVPGHFEAGKLPAVDWDTSSPSSWRSYLATGKNLGCLFVVLEKYEFDRTVLEELRQEGDDRESSEGDEQEDQVDSENNYEAKWNEIIEKSERNYGLVYAFTLYCFSAGICHRYEREAAWYIELKEMARVLQEEMEAAEADLEEAETSELTEEEIEQIGTELANYELFQKATNQNARHFALKKKFPKLSGEHPDQIWEVIDHAKGIFELEIKPEFEKAVDIQILDLSAQGFSKDQIAKKLKVPVSRVKKAS